ncbi:MAG TPA: DUF1854 domain-containing protein [Candidatus Egerieisoma faecipullorum]|uniref:DUF1854 domain-containing protein n=1 Tax=Candidatus Egerieisoma faecipullorum TaxID=2840963 RepID=A0A9D1I8M7_9CLOT|nr:DUF1854 domain-containing protein [Candidatus Egerieisoma faecipullorum]
MEEIAKMNYLASETLRFTKTKGGFLSLSVGEKTYARIMIQRAFPLSQPAGYLSVREVKENREPGEEIGIIEDLASLPEDQQKLVREELEMRYFTPDIIRIHKLKDEHGFVYMEAETTAGARSVTAHNNSSSFIRLSPKRMLIIDVDGNRYHIPDISALDKKSIRNLEVIV